MKNIRIKKIIRIAGLCCLTMFLIIGVTHGQNISNSSPRIIEKDGRHALLVDGRPFFMLGGQAHNSSGWPGMLPHVWAAIEAMHANTLEVPIYWEQIEAVPGEFDFSLMDTLLVQARARNVHLVLLWFATWKNGSNHYMPEWMKKDAAKYPNITGKDGQPVDSPSPFTKAAMELDAKAFTRVMEHLKEADPQHTVIMVQVENEPGSWGSVRDYSPAAQKLFEGRVPKVLLKSDVLKQLNAPTNAKGTWKEVFGDNADEFFHAWSVASYIEYVAAAGKAMNPLPLYVNAALRDPLTNPPASSYESGGATDNVIPIWKVAAPDIDLLAPDIYLSGSERILKVLDLYDRPDNTLFVPETSGGAGNVKYLYEVFAHGGIGFSPFGIDNNGQGDDVTATERLATLGQEYAMAAPMMRELAKWAYEGKIKAVVEKEDHGQQTIDLGKWQAVVGFGEGRRFSAPVNANGPQTAPTGKAMVIQIGENEFYLIGTNCRFTFKPLGENAGEAWQYLKVEEGHFENGVFKILRIRNGDETDFGGPRFGAEPVILHTTLTTR